MSALKIIFIGDIVGKIGRKAVGKIIPDLKKEYAPDLIIANGENLAHGTGITQKTLEEILQAGVDFLTSGNHIFDKQDIIPYLNRVPVIRPANYPDGAPGRGYEILKIAKHKLAVVNLLGRVFIGPPVDCPFRIIDEILKKIQKEKVSAIIVDFHAEATAEKIALFRYLDGRVSALLGTHTHIQTADEEISAQGTAYISDVGGVYGQETVIGVDQSVVLERFLTAMPVVHKFPESGKAVFNAVYLEIDTKTAKAAQIKKIYKII
ncbi:MAG: TIGR00282 family metallophosphoesterase [Candidatus Gracilibacteria bacterium]|nr:TIGR00282 family metallophosphoesterase [Candidatus Gracilibacteria bacterium]